MATDGHHERVERLVERLNDEHDMDIKQPEDQPDRPAGGFFSPGSLFSSAMTLANSAIGAGILSFPYAFKAAGVAAGIAITLVLCGLMGAALNIIARCCSARPELQSYGSVVRYHFEERYGRKAILVFDALMIFYVFGACIGYLMILYDMGHPVLQEIWSQDEVSSFFRKVFYPDGFVETTLSRAIIIGIPAVVAVLPLSLLRDISSLGYSSTFAIISVCFLAVTVLQKSATHLSDNGFPSKDMKWFHSPLGIAIAVPLTCFAFQCQIQVPPIYAGLQPQIKNMTNFNKVIFVAYTICIVLYVPVGCFGYFQFLDKTPHDILESSGDDPDAGYPLDDYQVLVARVCIMMSSIGAYPLNHYPAREAFHKLVNTMDIFTTGRLSGAMNVQPIPGDELPPCANPRGIPRMSDSFLWTSTVTFWLLSYILAVLIHDLSSVFDILGSTAAVVVIFIVPSQLTKELVRQTGGSQKLSWALLLFGITVGCVCTVVAILNLVAPSITKI